MNQKKTITITIPKDCKVKIDAEGFKGGSCKQATAGLVKRLSGGDAKDQMFEPKPEMNMVDNTPQQNHLRQ